jgi:antitoxin VapB
MLLAFGRKAEIMGMNIKNPETTELARELAALTGESLTTAVTIAVRERLVRIRRDQEPGLADRLTAIGKKSAPLFKEPFKSADHGDLLYDENGVPKSSALSAKVYRRRPSTI